MEPLPPEPAWLTCLDTAEVDAGADVASELFSSCKLKRAIRVPECKGEAARVTYVRWCRLVAWKALHPSSLVFPADGVPRHVPGKRSVVQYVPAAVLVDEDVVPSVQAYVTSRTEDLYFTSSADVWKIACVEARHCVPEATQDLNVNSLEPLLNCTLMMQLAATAQEAVLFGAFSSVAWIGCGVYGSKGRVVDVLCMDREGRLHAIGFLFTRATVIHDFAWLREAVAKWYPRVAGLWIVNFQEATVHKKNA